MFLNKGHCIVFFSGRELVFGNQSIAPVSGCNQEFPVSQGPDNEERKHIILNLSLKYELIPILPAHHRPALICISTPPWKVPKLEIKLPKHHQNNRFHGRFPQWKRT